MWFGAVIAHQGGWDEALFVAIPLALIFAALRSAKKRAEARDSDAAAASATPLDADDVGTQSP